MALLDNSPQLAVSNDNSVNQEPIKQKKSTTSSSSNASKPPTTAVPKISERDATAIPAVVDGSVGPEKLKVDAPAKRESEAGAADLFKIIDARYGYPIGSVRTEEMAMMFKELGFSGRGPIRDPDGLPDIPEAKELESWELEHNVEKLKIIAELLGDSRGQLRSIQLTFENGEGVEVTSAARSSVAKLLAGLKEPQATTWLQENIGTKAFIQIKGMKIECYAPTPIAHLIDIQGIQGPGIQSAKSPNKERVNIFAMREWTDKTGKFKVTAYFVRKTGSKIKLRKKDHTSIEIELEVLSPEDQEFVTSIKR